MKVWNFSIQKDVPGAASRLTPPGSCGLMCVDDEVGGGREGAGPGNKRLRAWRGGGVTAREAHMGLSKRANKRAKEERGRGGGGRGRRGSVLESLDGPLILTRRFL